MSFRTLETGSSAYARDVYRGAGATPPRVALPATPRPRRLQRPLSQSQISDIAPPRRKDSDQTMLSFISSSSSSEESVFDQLEQRMSKLSSTSSQTSFSSVEEMVALDVRKVPSVNDIQAAEGRPRESVGSSWWNKVSSAAGNLTSSVAKAWERGHDGGQGEPHERESHLTDVLRQYYLDRARVPSDLPDFLFEEHERNPDWASKAYNPPATQPSRKEGSNPDPFSQIIRDLSSSPSPSSTLPPLPKPPAASGSPPVNRLKVIREARRAAQLAAQSQLQSLSQSLPSPTTQPSYLQDRSPRSRDEQIVSGTGGRQRPVVGLPSGPARARRV